MPDNQSFAYTLISWYATHRRDLPWRDTKNPYAIWLSEVILQQTRVAQGLPYYYSFIQKYPTVKHLASASEEDVLRTWQGLGYYSRARNLHATAQQIVNRYDGKFPSNYQDLLQLKGVGTYTAAAIASFAYSEKVAVIDGNVHRVLARIIGLYEDPLSTPGKKTFSHTANNLLPEENSDTYNQAIMEFGALWCTPFTPRCAECPFQVICHAYIHNKIDTLPFKKKKNEVKNRYFNYLIFHTSNSVLLKKREGTDIWKGLYDFELWETKDDFADELSVRNKLGNHSRALCFNSEEYTHQLSHQKIHARFHFVELHEKTDTESFFTLSQTENLPKPVLISRYLKNKFIPYICNR